MLLCNIGSYLIECQSERYIIITNKQKSSQLKYISIRYLRKYIKLPVLLFTLGVTFQSGKCKQRLKRILLKDYYKACIK